MSFIRYLFPKRNKNKEEEKKEWERLKKETVNKMKKEAVDFKNRVTEEEYFQYNKMKIISALFLPVTFSLFLWNIIWGLVISFAISTIWFLFWIKKNKRYAFIFYFISALVSIYFLLSFLINKIVNLL